MDKNDTNTIIYKTTSDDKDLLISDVKSTNSSYDVINMLDDEEFKARLYKKASDIRQKNVDTQKQEYDNDLTELDIKHKKELLNKQHKYDMSMIDKDAKHIQMLDRRRKIVEKYSYLYDMKQDNIIHLIDGKQNEYAAPKDFSFSLFVNHMRRLGRDISKLNKPILQLLKISIWIILGTSIYTLLKKFNILK